MGTLDVKALEAKVRRLEACEAIRACIYSYAIAGDRGNDSAIVSRVFTKDAVYEAVGIGRYEGLENIVRGLADIARNFVLWSFHAPCGPLIRLADDLKSARAFWWVWAPVSLRDGNGEATPHWGAGHYNADLVEEGSVWKFRRVLFETRLRTPFEGPWTPIDGPFEWPI